MTADELKTIQNEALDVEMHLMPNHHGEEHASLAGVHVPRQVMRLVKGCHALLAEVKRLQLPIRCTACGAPDEAHVFDPESGYWRIWVVDRVYSVWGTLHSKRLRRIDDER